MIISALLGAAAVAASPMQFDLVCTGTQTSAGESKPFQVHLAVDLARRAWCWRQEGCPTAIDVRSITPSVIVLRSERAAFSDYDFTVNRTSGALYSMINGKLPDGDVITISETGTCEKAAYSGLPAAKF